MDHAEFIEYMNTAWNFNTLNGIRITELSKDYCACEVELTQKGRNAIGIAHGSLIFGLCDVAAGMAAASMGDGIVTLDANIHFLRPGTAGVLRATANVVKRGRATALYDTEVRDENGKLLAKGEFTMYFTGNKINLQERKERDERIQEEEETR